MIEPIKTYWGYTRHHAPWFGRIEPATCVSVSYIYRCTKCGLYLWTLDKAKEHNDKTNHP